MDQSVTIVDDVANLHRRIQQDIFRCQFLNLPPFLSPFPQPTNRDIPPPKKTCPKIGCENGSSIFFSSSCRQWHHFQYNSSTFHIFLAAPLLTPKKIKRVPTMQWLWLYISLPHIFSTFCYLESDHNTSL